MADYRADFHFTPIPVALLEDPDIKADHLAAYAAVRSFCTWGKHTGARVSDERAALRAGMSTRNFGRARTHLRAVGWLDWKRTGRTNSYVVRSAKLAEQKYQKRQAGNGGSDTLAEQTGQVGRTDQPAVPNDSNEKDLTKSVSPKGTKDTWLTPYADQHRRLVKGRFLFGRWAPHFKAAEEDHTPAQALVSQGAYLRDLVQRGSVRFLSYETWSTQVGYWLGHPEHSKPGRMTTSTAGKDFLG